VISLETIRVNHTRHFWKSTVALKSIQMIPPCKNIGGKFENRYIKIFCGDFQNGYIKTTLSAAIVSRDYCVEFVLFYRLHL